MEKPNSMILSYINVNNLDNGFSVSIGYKTDEDYFTTSKFFEKYSEVIAFINQFLRSSNGGE